MKRACLLLLIFLSPAPSIPGHAYAKLYEARLMGDAEEPPTLVELSDFEEAKMCVPAGEGFGEEDENLAPEKIAMPVPSGPMF